MTPVPRAPEVFVLHVALQELSPLIWRRLAVPAESTFHVFHEILQVAFSWEDHHLYEFQVGGETIAPSDPETPGAVTRDARFTRLRDILAAQTSFVYLYDFGDDWIHQITVEELVPLDPRAIYPRCLGGERAAPPEDSGGVDGYREILDLLGQPTHPEYAATRRWVGEDFRPEHFDLRRVNALLRRFKGSRPHPARRSDT